MRVISAVAMLLLSAAASAQTPATDDRFYRVIREDDLATLRTLVRDRAWRRRTRGADASDGGGSVRQPRERPHPARQQGRRPRRGHRRRHRPAPGDHGFHKDAVAPRCRGRRQRRHPDGPNAAHRGGLRPGTVDVVRQLLAKGASVNAADAVGITPLIAAASVNDADVVNLLLAHGADAAAASRGPVGTALQGAAANGNPALVKTLLVRS